MNEKLKFSWGHIIAFFAIIVVSYITFMGFMYLTDGNFFIAIAGMVLTDIIYLFVFIAAQVMKGSGNNISRKIIWERIFVFVSPAVFIAGMIAMSHFWTVQSQSGRIVSTFKSSINGSKALFDDYEEYAQERINNYTQGLNTIIAMKQTNPEAFRQVGFKDGMENIQRDNMIETLKLQLMSENYQNLKDNAVKWIGTASNGASVWNVFLLGNKREIRDAVINWEKELKKSAEPKLSNEELVGPVKTFESMGARNAVEGIDSLDSSYTTMKFPTVYAIIFGIVVYLMLLFPYLIQQRHGRQVAMRYSLWKTGKLDSTFADIGEPGEPSKSGSAAADDKTRESGKKRKFSRITLD